jgi:hypothetical protein
MPIGTDWYGVYTADGAKTGWARVTFGRSDGEADRARTSRIAHGGGRQRLA